MPSEDAVMMSLLAGARLTLQVTEGDHDPEVVVCCSYLRWCRLQMTKAADVTPKRIAAATANSEGRGRL